ncbi:MAG: hypothetical protein HQL24_02400 [Candidatus Omnitrophica bacterium]|nr:hypothetical protein [Candidatus Omnitrophota bacterium]
MQGGFFFRISRRIISFVLVIFLAFSPTASYSQNIFVSTLPEPGTMVSVSEAFSPVLIKGLVVNPKNPLEFQFIVDTGRRGSQDMTAVKEEATRLAKYFLAGLTMPEGDLWVNLSPYEKDRITSPSLGQTELGRDLLAQDYILKQLTASLLYPEKNLGKEFWNKIYEKAQRQFGTTNIPTNVFNKVWILPNEAQVFENGNSAYVTKSTLKVLLDEDYVAKQKNQTLQSSSISSQIVREIILPEIEKEVNTGKNFAPLRQIYEALILAKWYKQTIQNGLLDTIYINKKKVAGVHLNDPTVKEEIYNRYLQAYKKGAFNYIKESATPDGQIIPKKYFSGGISRIMPDHVDTDAAMSAVTISGEMLSLTIIITPARTEQDKEQLQQSFKNYAQTRIMGIKDLEIKALLQESWDSPYIYDIFEKLFYQGVTYTELFRLIDILIGLGVDVSDPWITSQTLSDIVSHLGTSLLGRDLSHLRPVVRIGEDRKINLSNNPFSIAMPEITPQDSLIELRKKYREFKAEQENLIRSTKNYHEIAREIQITNNNFLAALSQRILTIAWAQLGIPADQDAFIYFHDTKSIASDLDLIYQGPKLEDVDELLVKLFFVVGIKVDFWTMLMDTYNINDPKQEKSPESFYGGNILSININHGNFETFYVQQIEQINTRKTAILNMYNDAIKDRLNWKNETPDSLIAGIKENLYSPIDMLMKALSLKFNIGHGIYDESHFAQFLEPGRLTKEQVQTLEDSFFLANEIRNVLQIMVNRRWPGDNFNSSEKIRHILKDQGISDDLLKRITDMRDELDKIREQYFGEVTLPIISEDSPEQLSESWKAVAKSYRKMAQNAIDRSILIPKETEHQLIANAAEQLRQFYGELSQYAKDPQNSPYKNITSNAIWKAAQQFQESPEEFSDANLLKRASFPNITLLGVDQNTGRSTQVKVTGIPLEYRIKAANTLRSTAGLENLSIREGGYMTLEINAVGVDKSLPIKYVAENFDVILETIGYTPGPSINSRKTKTIIFSDGDGTLYGKPTATANPNLEESEGYNSFIEYLKAGGVYILVTGNDIQATKDRLIAGKGIPAHLRNRFLISANGGGNLFFIDPQGNLVEIERYKDEALIQLDTGKVNEIDAVYLGDDEKEYGNDMPAFKKIGLNRAISVSTNSSKEIPNGLSENSIGHEHVGTAAFLKTLVAHAQNQQQDQRLFDGTSLSNIIHETREGLGPKKDSAMAVNNVGGVDLNAINIQRQGNVIHVQFDPAQINHLLEDEFEGFSPIIININPIQKSFLLLGSRS